MKKCMVCQEECNEKPELIIRDTNIINPVVCCKTCFNLWTHQEYDKLTKRIKSTQNSPEAKKGGKK